MFLKHLLHSLAAQQKKSSYLLDIHSVSKNLHCDFVDELIGDKELLTLLNEVVFHEGITKRHAEKLSEYVKILASIHKVFLKDQSRLNKIIEDVDGVASSLINRFGIEKLSDDDVLTKIGKCFSEEVYFKDLILFLNDFPQGHQDFLCNYFIKHISSDEILTKLIATNYEPIVSAISKKKDAGVTILENLASSKASYSRECAARNNNCPEHMLLQLASEKDYSVRTAVAENPSASENALLMLASDENDRVRRGVAENPGASEKVLLLLAREQSDEHYLWNVRYCVANNSNASENVLLILAKDEESEVRAKVAQHPNASENVLLILAKDKDSEIRSKVAQNPNACANVLLKLIDCLYLHLQGWELREVLMEIAEKSQCL